MASAASEDWLSPMNKLIWIKAFKAKAKSVTLRDGRKFKIEYKQRNETDIVVVNPVKGRIPMGSFELKSVTESTWLHDGKAA